MTTPDKTHRVADWPRISATVRPDGSGVLTINKTDRLCHAASVDELRTGMIARCAVIAQQLRRPVRFEVTDDAGTWQLAIRPEGYVQLIDDAGKIPPADGLTVHDGPCRVCRHIQPITAATCEQCGIAGPHRVDVQVVGPPAEHAIERTPPSDTPAPATRPTLRLFLSTAHEPVDVDSAAIGRRPEPVDGRRPIAVHSPGRMLSRTHALVDVDDAGQILVTDHHSGNGVETATEPPMTFQPGRPYVVQPGTTLRLGDVTCRIELR